MLKFASILDYIRETLDRDIWDLSEKEVKLQPHVKDQIEDIVYSAIDDLELPDDAVKDVFIYGSILTNQYNPKTDIDARIVLDPEKVYERFGKEITGDDIFDLIIEQVHGIPVGHTKHPLNCSVIIEGEQTELGQAPLGKTENDPVYDVLNDKVVVPPVYKEDSDPDEDFAEEREEADVIMGQLDDMLRELKTDVIDYDYLEDAVKDVKDKDKLIAKLESKLEEIEQDTAGLVDEYGNIKDKRTEDYGEEGDRHQGPGNVRFKMIEKYQYLDILRKLKRIFKGGVTEKEVDELAETLHVSGQMSGHFSCEASLTTEDLEWIYELTYKHQMLSQEEKLGGDGLPQTLPDAAYMEKARIEQDLTSALDLAQQEMIETYQDWLEHHYEMNHETASETAREVEYNSLLDMDPQELAQRFDEQTVRTTIIEESAEYIRRQLMYDIEEEGEDIAYRKKPVEEEEDEYAERIKYLDSFASKNAQEYQKQMPFVEGPEWVEQESKTIEEELTDRMRALSIDDDLMDDALDQDRRNIIDELMNFVEENDLQELTDELTQDYLIETAYPNVEEMKLKLEDEWDGSDFSKKIILFQEALTTAHNNGSMAEYLLDNRNAVALLDELSEGQDVEKWNQDLSKLLGYEMGSRMAPKQEWFVPAFVKHLKQALKLMSDIQTDKISKEEVLAWFEQHPDPDDDDVHAFAESLGMEPHEFEEIVYSLLTDKM